MDAQTVSATVQAFASVVAAFATVAIGVFAWRSYRTAASALDAARREAEIAQRAVDAANLSVIEARRQTQLAHVPMVRLDRPKLAISPQGAKYLAIEATNLGPGHARAQAGRREPGSREWSVLSRYARHTARAAPARWVGN